MAVSREDVMRALRPDEPNFAVSSRELGDEAAPILADLVAGDDLELATKAASMAGFLSPDVAQPVLTRAAEHSDPVVRVAAAAALQRQRQTSTDLLRRLLADGDQGVRKWTLRSVRELQPEGLRADVEAMAAREEGALRALANDVAQELPR